MACRCLRDKERSRPPGGSMSIDEQTLLPMFRKLKMWMPLDEDDQKAVLRLPYQTKKLAPAQYIVRDGEKPSHCCLLLSGFAYRHKLTGQGARQIMSIHMKGDMVDL